MKEAESMSIPVIGGAGSWGNNIPGIEEDPMVSYVIALYLIRSLKTVRPPA